MLSIENSGNFSPPASTQKRCGSVRALVVRVPTRILISVAYPRALQAAVVSRALRALQASGGAVDRHRRLQSALRPSPGRLAPPAPRSRARAELSLSPCRRARPHATLLAVRRATGPSPAPCHGDAQGAHRSRAGREPSGGLHDEWQPRRGAGRAPRRRSNARSPGRLLCRYPRTRPKFPACAVAPRAFAPVATCGDVGGRGQETPEADTPRGMTFSRSSKG